jgi:hypothetical protein
MAVPSMRSRVWFDQVVHAYRREARAVDRPLKLDWTVVVRVLRDGTPVPDAVVTVESPRHAPHATVTDGSGSATVSSPFPGKVRFRAVAGPDVFEKTVEIGHGVAVTLDLER